MACLQMHGQIIFLVALFANAFVNGFTPPAAASNFAEQTRNRFPVSHKKTAGIVCRTQNAQWFLSATTNEVDEASDNLLELLLKRFNSQTTKNEDTQIENLMNVLQDSQSSFDPDNCLNGPLYAALYQTGPQPFWERFDLGFSFRNGRKNLKGQQYMNNEKGDFDLRNYAEFIGKLFSVEAVGTCRKNKVQASIAIERNTDTFPNLFSKLFYNAGKGSTASSLVKCPADYTIQATGVSFNLLNKKIDVNIQGTGYMRMLYADKRLRILTTPKDTVSSGNAVDEKAGLTVAQVRVDLIDPDFSF